MRFKTRFFSAVDRVDKIVATTALMSILVLVFYQVLSRYILGTSLRWSEEVSRYLMIYMIMFGLGAGIKRHKHLGVDAFVEALSGLPKKLVMTLAGVLSTGVYCVMAYYCLQMVLRTVRSGQVSPAAAIPMVLVYTALPLGFLLGALRQVDETWGVWHESGAKEGA